MLLPRGPSAVQRFQCRMNILGAGPLRKGQNRELHTGVHKAFKSGSDFCWCPGYGYRLQHLIVDGVCRLLSLPCLIQEPNPLSLCSPTRADHEPVIVGSHCADVEGDVMSDK